MVTVPITDKGSLEWIPELRFTTGEFGTFPTNPAMLSAGLVADFTVHSDKKLKSNTYLRSFTDVAKLTRQRTLPTGGAVTGSFTYYPQNWDIIPYIVGSGSTFTSNVDSISLLQFLDGKYTIISGVMLTDYTVNIPESDFVSVEVGFVAGDITDPSGVDPIGTGSHASENVGDPFLWQELADMRFGSTNPPTEELTQILGDVKLSIKNNVTMPAINSSVMFSYAGVPMLDRRDVELSLGFTWESVDAFWSIMSNSSKQYFSYSLGGKTFIVKRLIVSELNLKQDPDDYIGETVTFASDRADMVMWTDPLKMSSGAGIGMIPALSSNQTSTGIIVDDITVGENVAFGDLCYLKSDGKYWKADASAIATTRGPLLICLETITTNNAGKFIKRGYAREDTWAFTKADTLFVSLTSGEITSTSPSVQGECQRKIGYAYNTNIVVFEPSDLIIEL